MALSACPTRPEKRKQWTRMPAARLITLDFSLRGQHYGTLTSRREVNAGAHRRPGAVANVVLSERTVARLLDTMHARRAHYSIDGGLSWRVLRSPFCPGT
jgi:hypothetical protein